MSSTKGRFPGRDFLFCPIKKIEKIRQFEDDEASILKPETVSLKREEGEVGALVNKTQLQAFNMEGGVRRKQDGNRMTALSHVALQC